MTSAIRNGLYLRISQSLYFLCQMQQPYIVYSDTHIHADREVQAQGCRHSLRYTQKLVWRTLAAYLKSINSGVYLLGGLATWNSWRSVKANASRLGNC